MPAELLTTYRCAPTAPSSGALRVATVRYLPRGVPKRDHARYFDVWLPLLAPTQDLIRDFRSERLTQAAFFRAYRREMGRTDPRQAIELLARVSAFTPIAVGCYCEDEAHCHRSVLAELIRQAPATRG